MPDGRIGQLVRQLRHRGRTAMRQSRWLLMALIFATFVGLVFYLGLPFFRIAVDGRRDALNTTVEAIIAQNAALDADRARIVSDIALTLENVPRLVPTGTQNDLTGHIELADSTLIYGEDGVIIRSTDGGQTFAPIFSGVDESFLGHVIAGRNILIFGEDGVLTRSSDGGATFERVKTPIDRDFSGYVWHDQTLFLYSNLGGVVRSDDSGATFHRFTTPRGFLPYDHLKLTDSVLWLGGDINARFTDQQTPIEYFDVPDDWDFFLSKVAFDDLVLVWSSNTQLIRSFDRGETLQPVPEAKPEIFWRSVQTGSSVVMYGRHGERAPVSDRIGLIGNRSTEILVSFDGGKTFPTTHRFDGLEVYNDFQIGKRLFLTGLDGTHPVSDDGGRNFSRVRAQIDLVSSAQFNLANVDYIYGTQLFLSGGERPAGTLMRTANKGDTFERVYTGDAAFAHALTSDGVILYGQNGGIIRLSGNSDEPVPVPTGLPHDLIGHVVIGGQAFVYGGEGTVIDTTIGRASADWRDLSLPNGTGGDTEVTVLLAALQPQAQTAVANSERAFNALLAKRSTLGALQSETDADLEELTNLPYSLLLLKRQRESFAGFMATCRGVTDWSDPPQPRGVTGADPDAVTLACLQGWQTQTSADTDTWWATIAAQVPPGVLLLFLLATFGGLYRYNLRLAVFHNSRADALELLAAQQSDGGPPDLAALSEALAADKVEFSKASLPTDQVVSLANTLIGKIRPCSGIPALYTSSVLIRWSSPCPKRSL